MNAGYLAVDLGAESGRVVLGRFDGERVSLEEIHRFRNMPIKLPDGLHWDVLRILSEIKDGLAKAARETRIEGIGVDSWGVDFGLLDRDGCTRLESLPPPRRAHRGHDRGGFRADAEGGDL